MKIALILTHPAPYKDAFINKVVESGMFDVDVFSLFNIDKGHSFWELSAPKYSFVTLGADKHTWLLLSLKLIFQFVLSRKYDFVLWPGWTYPCLKLPILLSAILGKSYGFVADSNEQRPMSRFVLWFKRMVVKRAKMIQVPGMAGKRFFCSYFDKRENQIVLGAYALDGVCLEKLILDKKKSDRDSVRKKLGLSNDSKLFLMVANMIPTRHYPITVAGFLEFAEKAKNCVFLIVGEGEDLDAMQKVEREHKCVKVLPGCSFDETLSLYAASDIYVHGGKEPASTALVIGAIANLPIISSSAVGCSSDVLLDGKSGYQVSNYLSSSEWCNAFSRALADVKNWPQKGACARELSSRLDIESVIDHFNELVSACS